MLLKQIKKTFNRHLESLQKYIIASDIISKITATRSVSDSKGLNQVVQFWESKVPTFKLSSIKISCGGGGTLILVFANSLTLILAFEN